MFLSVWVHPRSSREELTGLRDGALVARVTEPPAEGRANRAVADLVAAALGVPRGAVGVVGGQRSRLKRLHVAGTTVVDVRGRLADFLDRT